MLKNNALNLQAKISDTVICGIQTKKSIWILDIWWNAIFKTTVEINEGIMLQNVMKDLISYNHCISSLLDRVRFVNIFIYSKLYYVLQILSMSVTFWGQVQKYIGYFYGIKICYVLQVHCCIGLLIKGGLPKTCSATNPGPTLSS